MSVASYDFQCVYISDHEQYNSDLMCGTCDLIQRYTGTPASPTFLTGNDYTTLKPVLQILLSNTDPTVTDADMGKRMIAAEWYINGAKIPFPTNADANGKRLSTAQVGNFPKGAFNQIVHGGASYPCGGLQFLSNIVGPLNGGSAVVKCVFSFEDNEGNMVTVQHTANIGCRLVSSDKYELEVYAKKENPAILTYTNQTVLLHVRVHKGATLEFDSDNSNLNTTKKLFWYAYDYDSANKWVKVVAKNNAQGETMFAYNSKGELTVGRDAVPTHLVVMAAVFPSTLTEQNPDPKDAEMVGFIRVNDETDALYIKPNPTPADGTLRAGETTPSGLTLAPELYDQDSSSKVSGVKFKFVCMSAAGTVLNGSPSGTPGAAGGFDTNKNNIADNTELLETYTVPRAMFEALNAGPRVLITAFKNT